MNWQLRISTFRGLTFGATHYYGRLHNQDYTKDVPLAYQLNVQEAAHFTAADSDFVYQPGSRSERWLDRERLLTEAKRLFRELSAPGDRLLLGISEKVLDRHPRPTPPPSL